MTDAKLTSPNLTMFKDERVPFSAIEAWLKAKEKGDWSWTKNMRCKYVKMYLDSRSNMVGLQDRDGVKITVKELMFQYQGEK